MKLSEQLRHSDTNLAMTCQACPSQWEGWLANGEWCYIRYRWGNLTIVVSRETQHYSNSPAFSKTLGDDLDGVICLEEVIKAVEDEGQ